MLLLILYISLAVAVSFLCSILEAVILSCSPSYLESLKVQKPKVYERISSLILNIEKSLAAILSLNTFAHTIGAAGAGAQAQRVFGNEWMTAFSVLLTLVILFVSEIIPKSIGARFWRQLLGFASLVLPILVFASYPLVVISGWLSKMIKGQGRQKLSREEMKAFADIGLRDGILSPDEHRILRSLMLLPNQAVKEIQTPFQQLFFLSTELDTDQAFEKAKSTSFSRIPIVDMPTQTVAGYVLKDDILLIKALDQNRSLESLKKPIIQIDPDMAVERLFIRLLNRHEHIAAVVDQSGQLQGLVTLEDVIELVIDKKIFDETDMQKPKSASVL